MKKSIYLPILILFCCPFLINTQKKRLLIPVTKPAPALPKRQIPDPQLSDFEKKQFFQAFANGNPDMVRSYLQKYPELANVRMSYFEPETGSQTPFIFLAIEARYYTSGILKMLLDAGANINERDDYGNNALSYAMLARGLVGLQPVYNFLIDNGADLNARNRDGKTPLIIAAELGSPDVVKRMISSRPLDITKISDEERKSSYLGLLPSDLRKTVSTHSLNPNIKDNTGKTALDHATARYEAFRNPKISISSNYLRIIELLKPVTAE